MSDTLKGILLDESSQFTLDELCRLCTTERAHIVAFVAEGVVEAQGDEGQWRFTATAVRRARTALRLERDLEINLSGVALALELMDEIQKLRQELQARR